MINIYGGSESPKEGDSWPAFIVISSNEEAWGNLYYYRAKLKEIYTGDDMENIDSVAIDDKIYNFIGEMVQDPVTDVVDKGIDAAEGIFKFVTDVVPGIIGGIKDLKGNLEKNFVGTIITGLLDLLKFVADILQMLANSFQTFNLGTDSDFTITYSADYLYTDGAGKINDEGSGNRDMFTKVGEYEKEDKNNKKANTIYIDGKNEGFTKDTPIPVIPGDLYYVALGDIALLDINFLTIDESVHKNDNSFWKPIRNFASAFIHIIFYIAAAILVIMLIIDGIKIVANNFKSPEERARHVEALQRFALSLIMLIGTIVIMAITIYGSKAIFSGIKKDESNQGPIRVNVKEAAYSFSTTVTGYYRYMSEIEDVDRYLEKGKYTLAYVVLVIVNLIVMIFMFFRMLGMMVLAMVGSVVAVLHGLNISGGMTYKTWVELYIRLALVQVIMGIMYRIILNCMV